MKEYIEREQAIALFYPVDPENDGSDGCTIVYKSGNFSSSEIEAMLLDLPAADVAEVRHGRWIFEPGKIPYCSECKEYSDDGDKGATTCPWCGARMGKEAKQ
jgi:hypothetical protein